MSVLNKMSKGLFYTFLALYMIIQSYGFALLGSGALLSIVLAVWTIIKPLPSVMTEKMWLVYLLSGIPASIYVFVYLIVDLIKNRSKKHKKQDNGNH